MTREEALQEAVRAMRHERNLRQRLDEATEAVTIVRSDYEAARSISEAALSVLDIPAFLSGEKK